MLKLLKAVTQQLLTVLSDGCEPASQPSSLRSLGAQATGDSLSASTQGASTSGVMPPAGPSTAGTEFGSSNAFTHEQPPAARLHGPTATDVYRQMRQLLVLSESKAEAQTAVCTAEGDEVFNGFFDAVGPFVATDVNVALYTCSVISNLCVFPDCRDALHVAALVDLATLAIASHPTQKKLVHLALMTISNVALSGRVVLTETTAKSVAAAIAPLYSEARVVEAWTAALCNLSACSAVATTHLLLANNAVATLERLLVFHGDDARVAHRGLQALSHLCAGHIAAPTPSESPGPPPS